jgi:hypothetical protein
MDTNEHESKEARAGTPGFPLVFIRVQSWSKVFPLVWLTVFLLAPTLFAAELPLGLSVKDGLLQLRGQPFRGMGVNYYDAFNRTLGATNDTSYEAGFKTLRAHGIPFARFAAYGYWPVNMSLYQTNRAEYFQRLDGVVRAAETNGIGLIPSLFWYLPTVPDLVGESCDQWGNPASKTHAFLRAYIRELVTRYRNSPAIWAWEFGNEHNLAVDLPNAAEHRPPVILALGTANSRGPKDDITSTMVQNALSAFADETRRHDPHRLLITGHAIPRRAAWHLAKEKTWTKDSPAQFTEVLASENPPPFDVLSLHIYPEDADRLTIAAKAARELKKPLFVGEFGVPGKATQEARKHFEELISGLAREQVPFSAVWVFDFREQPEYTIETGNDRFHQLEAVAAANQKLKTGK